MKTVYPRRVMDFFRYCLARLRLEFRRHVSFVSLGYNCELGFRYNARNGFVDSGLFTWAYSHTLDELIFAIEHLEMMYADEVNDPNPLYECTATHIREHGKEPIDRWFGGVKDADRARMEADKADLVGRITYLKEKFVRTLATGDALVMYKIRSDELMAADAAAKLNRLIAGLESLGARDFDFVLVCEEKCRDKPIALKYDRSFVRYVRAFNPDESVTNADLGDRYGWRLLFDEFRPRHRKPKKHKFKFEK